MNPDRFPAIVVMPQCPEKVWWDAALDDVRISLEKTREEFTVDPDRIYLTGLSMGGYGTWIYGAMEIDTFAALMPICGGGKVEDAATLAKRPIWAFHGGADETVKPEESRKMVEAVKKAGGKVQYTEYKGVGHNSWDAAYGDPKAIQWLFAQRKK
jgi:predicted peptidase